MKKLKYILLMVGVLAFTSCESLLDEDPEYTINSKTQFSTPENAQRALYACYGYMTADNAYGQAWQELTMAYSALGWTQTNASSTDLITSLDGKPIDEVIVAMGWRGMYKIIGEVNAYIANLEASSLEKPVKLQFGAEARFLRALAYYNLAVVYGDVPLKITPSAHDAVAMPRVPKAQIFEQVRSDWEYAFANLAEKANDGFASKWAAKAYLGKLYYTLACQGDETAWSKAKTCFDEVYGKYMLEPKFDKLFADYVTGSKESIFQLNFALAGSSTRNRGSWLVTPNGACNGQAWDRVRASKAIYDYCMAAYQGDPRMETTFLSKWRLYNIGKGVRPQEEPLPSARDSGYAYPYFTYTVKDEKPLPGWKKPMLYVGKMPYEKFANPASPTKAEILTVIGKATTPYQKGLKSFLENLTEKPAANTKSWPYFKKPSDPNQSGNNSHKNLILYRYADMLLMMADVYNELNDKDKAISLADEVLRRARNSGKVASAQPARWSGNLSKEQVREKIFIERIVEGLGEPEMYQNVRLRGTEFLKKVLEMNNAHGIIRASVDNNPNRKGAWGERLFNKGNLNDADFLKKNLLLPIPKDEIDTNSALDYTDNNFGYF